MFIDFLLQRFKEDKDKTAIVWKEQLFTYSFLLERTDYWLTRLDRESITAGTVTVLEGDFSPESLALLLALIERGCIVVPLTEAVETQKDEFIETAQGEISFSIDENDQASIRKLPYSGQHELYEELRSRKHPGLVLFSSGTTGKSKAILHDVHHLLKKYTIKRHDFTTLAFLLFDHIAGIDTLLYVLSNGSCLVTVEDRAPHSICRAIEKFKVEVLPVSATFLNLLIFSEAYKKYDLSSLKYIAYGSEVMLEATLKKCAMLFPDVTILQKYGTTEVGTLRSKSKSSDSLWMKIGGEGFETRIVDTILQIKAHSAMMGYLNAPTPFTDDGWFITGDTVEEDGEYIRIHGRHCDIINVGGEKVFPTEVENLIQTMDNVAEVLVYGEKNNITGNIVCADISLITEEDTKECIIRVKQFCAKNIQPYKIPIKIHIVDGLKLSERFKKVRRK
ncbi:MAG: fatty acid--CoA ligase family protein [Thermodesulfobacteriota bacterium]|nr:fatty acid--CoA ligase family protein [Thermodesulfobacteriota bacterium]